MAARWCASGQTPQIRGEVGHVLGLTAHAELLEAAELGDLQVDVLDVPLVVEEDVDLAVAFQAGDGVDGDAFHGGVEKIRNPKYRNPKANLKHI